MKNSHVHSPRIMFANHLNRKQNLEGTAVNNTSDDGSPDGEDLFDSENRVTTGEDVMAVLRKTLRGMQLKMNQGKKYSNIPRPDCHISLLFVDFSENLVKQVSSSSFMIFLPFFAFFFRFVTFST